MRVISRTLAYLCAALIAFDATGCSVLTKSGRQQASYNRYLRRATVARTRQKVKYGKPQKVQPPTLENSLINASASGPESETRGSSDQ